MKKFMIISSALLISLLLAALVCACTIDQGDPIPDTGAEPTSGGETEPVTAEGTYGTTVPSTEETAAPVTSAEPAVTTGITTTEPATETTVTTETPTTSTAQITLPVITAPVFKADLSDYEKYMNPVDEDWSDVYLVLLNAANPMPKDFENKTEYAYLNSRVKVGSTGIFTYSPSLYFNETAFNAFTAMVLEAHEYGIDSIDITSGYRSYSKQQSLFNNNVSKTKKYVCDSCEHVSITKNSYKKCELCGSAVTEVEITYEEAAAQVATYSCAPGTSDHQSGLAVDVVQTTLPSKYKSLIQEFGTTECGIWLAEHCWEFGFILRFPSDKEEVTGIIYEPWHFRFVGRYHSLMMHELDICLEEYLVYLEETGYFEEESGVTSEMCKNIIPEYPETAAGED